MNFHIIKQLNKVQYLPKHIQPKLLSPISPKFPIQTNNPIKKSYTITFHHKKDRLVNQK